MWRELGKIALALGLLFVVGLLAYRFFDDMDGDTARVWAFVATVLFVVVTPGTAFAGWYFGHTEARGRLSGIDQAVDKVMGVADQVVSMKVNATKMVREEPPQVVVLPGPEPAYRLRQPDDSRIIDVG